ncbi:ImmA/IrrE family metallo-endopeptidase [Roseiarcus sp.]|uniref:ImmA/IrrE family metallo-endopeptidase n=1 Tax=Roseiarcus sp. TaxID=1969460 RepID=UPI003F965818
MSDYRDTKRWSNAQIHDIARRVRHVFDVSRDKCVDIVKCLTSGWVATIEGRKRLTIEIVSDDGMGGDDGLTEVVGDLVRMRFKSSVWQKAMASDGRARMTLAHELGHAVLCHKDVARARQTGAAAIIAKASYVEAYESSERMANEFASHFLIEEELLSPYNSIELVVLDFSVSAKAAKVRLERKSENTKRQTVINGFAELLGTLGDKRPPLNETTRKSANDDNKDESKTGYSIALRRGACQKCGTGKMVDIGGSRYRCEECGIAGDFLQDGDDFVEIL